MGGLYHVIKVSFCSLETKTNYTLSKFIGVGGVVVIVRDCGSKDPELKTPLKQ